MGSHHDHVLSSGKFPSPRHKNSSAKSRKRKFSRQEQVHNDIADAFFKHMFNYLAYVKSSFYQESNDDILSILLRQISTWLQATYKLAISTGLSVEQV